MASDPTGNRISKADFRRRLGYYLVGLAIGCVMMGMIYRARRAHWERQQQEALRQAEEARIEQQSAKPPPAPPADQSN